MPSRQSLPSLSDLLQPPKPTPLSSQTIEADILIAMRYLEYLEKKQMRKGERIGRLITEVFGAGANGETIFYHPGDIVIYAPDTNAPGKLSKVGIETPLTPNARKRGTNPKFIRGIPAAFVKAINPEDYSMPVR